MEIEAKFTVPSRQVYQRLARLRTLAGYTLISAGSAQVTDDYFDVADRRLLAAGYACRLRGEGNTYIATLKGLGGVEGPIHRRAEHEVRLAVGTADVNAWPDSSARALALELTGGAPLAPLFRLTQTRTRADVVDGERHVAQFSLDAVNVTLDQRSSSYYELEVELAPAGVEADLAAVAAELATTWALAPEPRSKFARGLALLDAGGNARSVELTPQERIRLTAYAEGVNAPRAARAKAVLGRADGLATREIVARSGLSAGRVRFWLRAFRARRMDVFLEPLQQGADTPGAGQGAGAAGQPASRRRTRPASQPATAPTPPSASAPTPGGFPTLAAFCHQHRVNSQHARHVAKQAVALFNALKPAHRLPRKRRKLLQQAAQLCTIGATTDPEHPYTAGRDLILAQPLRDVSTADRLALACIVAFQRDKVKPERELTLTALDEKQQGQVLVLAALLLMAEALDFSGTQTTQVSAVEGVDAKQCEVTVVGPQAEVDALQALGRAGLWYQLFKQEIAFLPAESELESGVAAVRSAEQENPVSVGAELEPTEGEAAVATAVLPDIPPVRPDEAMSEAGRKVLFTHFARMLANEAGTRLGEDIEALHDMRVATRRMRAAYRVFAPYFDPEAVRPYNKGLQRAGRMLGAVRDLDVLLEKAVAYQASLTPMEDAAALEPLLADWRTRREIARRQMLEYLDGPAYRQFATNFEGFLTTPGAGVLSRAPGEASPYQVRHVAPGLIWAGYEAVRAYEPILDGAPITTYHRLRIDCKRFRYALEFFRGVLGPETPNLLKSVVALQDLLGALHDAYVAAALIQEFLDSQRARRKKKTAALAGMAGYLAAQHAAQATLLTEFPELWHATIGPDFRRDLALAVAVV